MLATNVSEAATGVGPVGERLPVQDRNAHVPGDGPSVRAGHGGEVARRTARLIASAEMARDTSLNPGSGPKTGAGFGR